MTTASGKYDFVDCAALFAEATQCGDRTHLCPPDGRQSATVGDTIALAVQHPQLEDCMHLVYATITRRTHSALTATTLHPHRITQPPHITAAYHDSMTSDDAHWCTLREGDTVHCQARHVGWVVAKMDVREPVGWEERRRVLLEETRAREEKERSFDAARGECTFQKGSMVQVDAKLLKQEKKQRKAERKQGKDTKSAASDTKEDMFDYDL